MTVPHGPRPRPRALGTDGVGADVLSWLMAGSRTNLAMALLTVAVSGIFGLALVAAMVSRNTVLRSRR